MSHLATDEGLWGNDQHRHARDRRGSADLHAALWREHPGRMWSLAMEGKVELPSHLRGLRLSAPKPKEERLFDPEAPGEPQTFYAEPNWIRRLLLAVCEQHGVTIHELRGPARFARYVEARRTAATMLHARNLSYAQIAFHLGRSDHSTACNLVNGRKRRPAPDKQGSGQ